MAASQDNSVHSDLQDFISPESAASVCGSMSV